MTIEKKNMNLSKKKQKINVLRIFREIMII